MNYGHANHTWQFECVLSNGAKIKSWFYSDSREDATRRVTEYLGAKLISLKEIDDPLELRKKEQDKAKIKAELDNKKKHNLESKNYE